MKNNLPQKKNPTVMLIDTGSCFSFADEKKLIRPNNNKNHTISKPPRPLCTKYASNNHDIIFP